MGETCEHPEDKRIDGPRSPLRYGSAPTQVCTACGWWRLMGRWLSAWEPGPVDTEQDPEA